MVPPCHGADTLLSAAEAALGPCRLTSDLSWPHGESFVAELVSGDGRRYVGKAHRRPEKFAAELHAYRVWTASLGPHAPALVAADETRRVLVLSKVEGDLPTEPTERLFGEAGRLLRRFHEAEAPVPLRGYAQSERRRLERWLDRARPGLITASEVDVARRGIEVLARLGDPLGVPSHHDWQPRNWLVDGTGHLTVIDFEHSRRSPWYSDLERLWWNEWAERPDLRDAFLAAYGRTVDDEAYRAFMASSAVDHLVTVVWADEHGDPGYSDFARCQLATVVVDDD